MYPAFVASGVGIARGQRVGHVRNLDIAPTIAHLLGLDLPSATGVVMTEILQTSEVEDTATAYMHAIQNQDWERMVELLDATAIYQDFTMEYFGRDAIDLVGADAIVDFWRTSSEDSGTSEIRYVVNEKFVAGPAVVYIMSITERVSGAYWSVDKPEIELRGRLVTFVRVENARITHHIDFTDYASAMAQIESQR